MACLDCLKILLAALPDVLEVHSYRPFEAGSRVAAHGFVDCGACLRRRLKACRACQGGRTLGNACVGEDNVGGFEDLLCIGGIEHIAAVKEGPIRPQGGRLQGTCRWPACFSCARATVRLRATLSQTDCEVTELTTLQAVPCS